MCGAIVSRTPNISHTGSSQRFPTDVHPGSPQGFVTKVHAGSSTKVRGKNPRGTAGANPRLKNRRGTGVRNLRQEPSSGTTVLKLGGELLDDPARLKAIARLIARAGQRLRLVVVHGGGKAIDRALADAAIPKQQVDGLRVTDEATLKVVIAVLAGSINTSFVAAINAAGGKGVGLTGADAGVAPVKPARAHRASTGELVDLGLVGEPVGGVGAPLVETLCAEGFVPVIACLGASRDGRLFNVNADTLASSLASRLGATRLILAGATPGVLDRGGRTIRAIDSRDIDGLVSSGTATAGMIAKLRACQTVTKGRATDVLIADGRQPAALAALIEGKAPRHGAWTRVQADRAINTARRANDSRRPN
jgi:acetylglutamate kinase